MNPPIETTRFGLRDFVFFFATFVFVFTQCFQLPFTPIYFDGDVMASVTAAMRMLEGEVIYRDFFFVTTPGTEFFYKIFFSIFGPKVWVLNLTLVALAMAQVWLIWFFSRKVLTGWSIYLPAAIYLVIGYRQFGQDGTYRLFSVICALAAVAVLIEGRSFRRLLIAGCLCGLSSSFGQHRGVAALAGIFAFVIWQNFREGCNFKMLVRSGLTQLTGFVATFFITQAPFIWQAGFDNYYFHTVEFLRDNYRKDSMNNVSVYLGELPVFGETSLFTYLKAAFTPLFYYVLIPFTYLLFPFVWRKAKRAYMLGETSTALWLLWFVGIFLALGVSAPSAARYYHVAIPGLVLLVWIIYQNAFLRRLILAAVVLLWVLGFAYIIQRQLTTKYFLEMPAGHAAFLNDSTYNRYKWIGENTQPGEKLYEPHHPDFYFPFYLKNPTKFYLIRDSAFTPRFQIESILSDLETKRPRLIIWPNAWSKPAESRRPDDPMKPLWQFIQSNYRVKTVFEETYKPNRATFGDLEVWEIAN